MLSKTEIARDVRQLTRWATTQGANISPEDYINLTYTLTSGQNYEWTAAGGSRGIIRVHIIWKQGAPSYTFVVGDELMTVGLDSTFFRTVKV